MASEYDFIIVGSGPAGSALAYVLGNSPKKPKILLLEAGGPNDDRNLRVDGQRWLTFLNKDMNWGYQTVPQKHAGNRTLDYSRGKGLGGSSAINFGVFTIGASGDYDEWARLVDDDAFSWPEMQARLKKLETFHRQVPPGINASTYASPLASNHGSSGPLHVSYAAEWESDLPPLLSAFHSAGYPLNPDHNSGNPLGMSVLISSAHAGLRSTARDLLLSLPPNVAIQTNTTVRRLVFSPTDPTLAIGVETTTGARLLAAKEVLLAAGALNSPHILMHSGIGPPDQLAKFNIPLVHPSPEIGSNLRDHAFAPLVYRRPPGSPRSDRAQFYHPANQPLRDAALAQWQTDGTGPWATYACELGMGYFKLPSLATTPEFLALPPDVQAHLNRPTVPHYEVLTHFPVHWFAPELFPEGDDYEYAALLVFLYNAQAKGEARLQSADAAVPLGFDPGFLGEGFDRRVAVEAMREVMGFAEGEGWEVRAAPEGKGWEEVEGYWRGAVSSSWHMTGTVGMGADGGEKPVDGDFRVRGVRGVRVADMSVVPVLASGHTQAVAYVTGWTCADKIVKEYGLDQ
ncbi:hypothetical protein QBC39DRAFT_392602 [Podospora conica]|nr:hypothetical protein QBC39DRAFT_392602 [Schizothecium conicum]